LKVNDYVDKWIDTCDCIPMPYCYCDKYWTIAKIVELDDKKFKYRLLASSEEDFDYDKIIEEEFNFELYGNDQIRPLTFDYKLIVMYEDKEFWERYNKIEEKLDFIHNSDKCLSLYEKFKNCTEDELRKALYNEQLEILEKNYEKQIKALKEDHNKNLFNLKNKYFI